MTIFGLIFPRTILVAAIFIAATFFIYLIFAIRSYIQSSALVRSTIKKLRSHRISQCTGMTRFFDDFRMDKLSRLSGADFDSWSDISDIKSDRITNNTLDRIPGGENILLPLTKFIMIDKNGFSVREIVEKHRHSATIFDGNE